MILTGAGVSADSGVSTFRDEGGIWSRYSIEEVATPDAFARDPAKVHGFYNERRAGLAGVEPNAAHHALARLEREMAARGGEVTLISQNVDDLHARAGSQNLLPMHGELSKVRCNTCGHVVPWAEDLSSVEECAGCGEAGGLRPHVVWFGEIPHHLDEIAEALEAADLFVAIGTSGSVYPAAGLVAEARALGIPCVELNLEPSDNARLFTEARYGRASEIVPAWVDEFLAGHTSV